MFWNSQLAILTGLEVQTFPFKCSVVLRPHNFNFGLILSNLQLPTLWSKLAITFLYSYHYISHDYVTNT